MAIDLKTVKHISKLSRISLDDEKAKKLAGDLNSIFKFIEKLNKLNTDKIEPLTSIAETDLKLRKDEVKSKNIRDEILKNSPYDQEIINSANKGRVGNIIEKHWFGIENNSYAEPDFKTAGIELKVSPIKELKSTSLVVKERTKKDFLK